MVLPLILIELWCVLVAVIPFVCIKFSIIKFLLKKDFKNTLFKLVWVNFVTIVIGYSVQGFMRLSVCMVIPRIYDYGEFINGLFGNVGSDVTPMHLFTRLPLSTTTELLTSFILIVLISVIAERKKIEKLYHNEEGKRAISIAVFKANIISYGILFIWITYYVAVN